MIWIVVLVAVIGYLLLGCLFVGVMNHFDKKPGTDDDYVGVYLWPFGMIVLAAMGLSQGLSAIVR